MGNKTNTYADIMLDRINQCVDQKTKNLSIISGAVVNSVNTDGTINVYLPPDKNKVFTNISNQTPFSLKQGDSVELLLKDGSYNNCWIIAKHQTTYNGAAELSSLMEQYATLDDLQKMQASLLTEVDPIYSASPAATITQQDITKWNETISVSPTTTTPKMDGTAAVGSQSLYARGDHVHPTDTSRQATITTSGILKGNGSGVISAAVEGADYQGPLPSQSGNNGKFLTTNGTNLSWGDAGSSLPSQSGQSGKFLTTDGTDANWGSIAFPVTSVNTKTGAVMLTASDVGALADTYVPPVSSVNSKTGAVILTASDVGALADNTTYVSSFNGNSGAVTYTAPVTSVNTKTGAVSLSASDVGALPDSTSIPSSTSDLVNDSGFITSSSVPSAYTSTPLVDGIGSAGTATTWAKGDHVHPTDTSRAPIASPQFTGVPTAPTAATGTNTTQLATTEFVQSAVVAAGGGASPSVANPLMDGTASPGTAAPYSREDHVHPSDTSRQPIITISGILKGGGSGTITAAISGTDYLAPSDAMTTSDIDAAIAAVGS